MPCYRCGVRQTDPDRGPSPWQRGVRHNSQILICPTCQSTGEWRADLDRCAQCSSLRLVRRLGEVECRDCGATVPPSHEDADQLTGAGLAGPGRADSGLAGPGLPDTGPSPGLSEEVARALDRVLRQGLVSQSPASQAHGQPRPARPGAITR
jgi:hypothetical protein